MEFSRGLVESFARPRNFEIDIDFQFHSSILFEFTDPTSDLEKELPMIVCHCNGVSDRTLRRSIRSGVTTLSGLQEVCGAGSCCGSCTPTLRSLLRKEASREAREKPSAERTQTAAFA